ncbi:hypothetical protein L9F63_021968, partial [Diploptera punctata]
LPSFQGLPILNQYRPIYIYLSELPTREHHIEENSPLNLSSTESSDTISVNLCRGNTVFVSMRKFSSGWFKELHSFTLMQSFYGRRLDQNLILQPIVKEFTESTQNVRFVPQYISDTFAAALSNMAGICTMCTIQMA